MAAALDLIEVRDALPDRPDWTGTWSDLLAPVARYVLLQCALLAWADGVFHVAEAKLIDRLRDRLEVGEDDLSRVVAWAEKKVDQFEIETLTLIAAPRFLGELRKLYSPMLEGRIREQQGDLTQLTTGSLARHPTVVDLLPPEDATA